MKHDYHSFSTAPTSTISNNYNVYMIYIYIYLVQGINKEKTFFKDASSGKNPLTGS